MKAGPLKWLLLAAGALVWGAVAQEDQAPVQPIPFSHKVHAGTLKLQCKMCHPNPDPGETMTIVPPAACMQCHSAIKTDSPAIQKLAQANQSGQRIKWARIYAIPSYVFFSHRTHLKKSNICEDCHGPVAGRDRLYKERDLSMGGCMDCHRMKKASIDCSFCHEPR